MFLKTVFFGAFAGLLGFFLLTIALTTTSVAQSQSAPRNGFLAWLLKQESVRGYVDRSPMLKFSIKLASNEKFSNGFMTVLHFKDWKRLFVLEIIAVILMMVIKSWRIAMLDNDDWLPRFSIGIWTTLFGWFVTFIVIPTVMMKKQYLDLLVGTFEVLTS